ncbi:hypothetical protein DUI87_06961 [Hirundo rustica rustica]|uniref:Uncharacterized protein n=1 Tax=Hirundo rustica rustica TaxID=333673 RepID=A0A3M0KNU6_HIRRU|nr:hypothetical protein DUI87_06961 [Hirundo rustica rustica]
MSKQMPPPRQHPTLKALLLQGPHSKCSSQVLPDKSWTEDPIQDSPQALCYDCRTDRPSAKLETLNFLLQKLDQVTQMEMK